MSQVARSRPLVAGTYRWLRWAAWSCLGAAGSAAIVVSLGGGSTVPDQILLPGLGLLFVVLTLRVVLAMVQWPHRRASLGALLAALLLWCAGSALLNGDPSSGVVAFPSPSESLFMLAAAGFAAFLVLDVERRSAWSASIWIDAIVLCGGAAVMASLVVLLPTAAMSHVEGGALLVALIFPIFDLILALVVVGQVAVRTRPADRRSLSLGLGFLALAIADASLSQSAAGGDYSFNLWQDLMWGIALALITLAASDTRRSVQSGTRGQTRSAVVMVCASLALAVLLLLVLRPPAAQGWYLAVPAVVTLLAVGGKLVLALREAQRATESYRLAETDDLTGLANRRALVRHISERLEGGHGACLLLFDLDGFKEVNDSLGHGAGDEVLQTVASRLREATPPSHFLARLGGDEFAILTPAAEPDAGVALAQRIRTDLAEPVRVAGLNWTIDASVGVGKTGAEPTTSSDLLRRADVAMYDAKRTRSGVEVYDADNDSFSRHRLQLVEELRSGIGSDQLELWYQPQLSASTLDIVGMEALVRWRHPLEGLIPPALFLPVARRSGLMGALSLKVIEQAVGQAVIWHQQGRHWRVSINIAPPELLRGPVVPRLYELLAASGLPRNSVVIEVTEDSFINDPQRARELLVDMDGRGVSISIDDFGTGFSSLAYLRDLPIRELKIDRSFIADGLADDRSRLIVESTLQMAHALGLQTVAEGVEDLEAHDILCSLGVSVLQGFLYSRPLPVTDVLGWAAALRSMPEFGAIARGGMPGVDTAFLGSTAAS